MSQGLATDLCRGHTPSLLDSSETCDFNTSSVDSVDNMSSIDVLPHLLRRLLVEAFQVQLCFGLRPGTRVIGMGKVNGRT